MPTINDSLLYYKYEADKYEFYETVQKILGVSTRLELISNTIDQVTFNNDTSTDYHTMYYNSPYYKEMTDIYDRFLIENILPLFNEDIVVQKEPSFRIHLPNNTALGKCSTDTDSEIIGIHCDADYNHPPEEINFILSITGQESTNSLYMESYPNKADFISVKIDKGEFISFYGNKCRHYNKLNLTGNTRVSIDFRVIPFSQYKEYDSVAIHSNRKFCIGDYFKLLRKSDYNIPLKV